MALTWEELRYKIAANEIDPHALTLDGGYENPAGHTWILAEYVDGLLVQGLALLEPYEIIEHSEEVIDPETGESTGFYNPTYIAPPHPLLVYPYVYGSFETLYPDGFVEKRPNTKSGVLTDREYNSGSITIPDDAPPVLESHWAYRRHLTLMVQENVEDAHWELGIDGITVMTVISETLGIEILKGYTGLNMLKIVRFGRYRIVLVGNRRYSNITPWLAPVLLLGASMFLMSGAVPPPRRPRKS